EISRQRLAIGLDGWRERRGEDLPALVENLAQVDECRVAEGMRGRLGIVLEQCGAFGAHVRGHAFAPPLVFQNASMNALRMRSCRPSSMSRTISYMSPSATRASRSVR